MTTAGSLVRALLVAFLAVPFGLCLAAPAQAATTPSKSIVPFMNCYWDNGDGTYDALVGYNNKNSTAQTIPVGTNNRFQPGAQYRGQPTVFQPGTKNNVFVVKATAADVSNGLNWYLTDNTVIISTPVKCSTKPVSQVGDMRALALAVLLFTGTGIAVLIAGNRRHGVYA
jgi:hypothetical protein